MIFAYCVSTVKVIPFHQSRTRLMREEEFRQSLRAYDHTSEIIQRRRERARRIAVAARLAEVAAEAAAVIIRVAYARGELTPVHNDDDDQLIAVQPAAPSKSDTKQQQDVHKLGVRRLSLPNISGISAAPRNFNFIGLAPKCMTLAQLRKVISCNAQTLWCYTCKLKFSFISLVNFQEHVWSVHNINLSLPSRLPRKFANSISLSEFSASSWETQCYNQEGSPTSDSTTEFLTPPQDNSCSLPATPTFKSVSFAERIHSAVNTGVTQVALNFVRPEVAARLASKTTTAVVAPPVRQPAAATVAAKTTTSVVAPPVTNTLGPTGLPLCPIHAAKSTDLSVLLATPNVLCSCPKEPTSPSCPVHAHPSDWLTLQTDSITCTCKDRVRPHLPLTVPINVPKEDKPRTRNQGVPQGHFEPHTQVFVPKQK